MPLDWDRLRVFHKVARAGSFTHAADGLNLSQSAVSRQISALEAEVGVPLFHRHARGLLLTEQGDILFRAAEDVSDRLHKAADAITDFKGETRGVLRVTTTVGLGSAWLAIRLHEFLDAYPDIQVELILSNKERDIVMREADCALRLRQPQQADVVQRKLFTVHFHVYASRDYLARHGTPQRLDDLDQHRIVVWGEETPGYLSDVNWLVHAGMEPGQTREPALKINSILAIRRAVQRGAGIALLPDYSVEEGGQMQRIMVETDVPSFDTYFAYPAELRNSARLMAFRDFLLKQSKGWQF